MAEIEKKPKKNQFFTKGHKNLYEGKKIKVSEFADVWNMYATCQISQVKAAKMLGISTPTFAKWAREIVENNGADEKTSFLIWEEGYK